jgi:transcriptional regulator of heat shock response
VLNGIVGREIAAEPEFKYSDAFLAKQGEGFTWTPENLTAYLEDPGLIVVIGTEHLSPDFQSLSLVLTTCTDDARVGVVGILGPTRMRYSRAIAAVDSVSHAMSRVFAS